MGAVLCRETATGSHCARCNFKFLRKANFAFFATSCSDSSSPFHPFCFWLLVLPDLRLTRRLWQPTRRQRMQSGLLQDRLPKHSATTPHWLPMLKRNARLLPWPSSILPTLGWSEIPARSAPLALSALLATSDPLGFVDPLDVLLLANKFLIEADSLVNTYL